MGSCELCGKSASLVSAVIEGVEMKACSTCSGHGTILKRPTRVAKKRTIRQEPEFVDEVRRDFAAIFRGERSKRSMTQKAFAQLLGEKESVVVHYEHGTHKPSIGAARRFEKILKIALVERVSTESEFTIKKPSSGIITIGDMIKIRKK